MNKCVVRTRGQLPDGLLFLTLPGATAGMTDLRVTAVGPAAQPTTVRGQVVFEQHDIGTKDCPLSVVTALATWTANGAITS